MHILYLFYIYFLKRHLPVLSENKPFTVLTPMNTYSWSVGHQPSKLSKVFSNATLHEQLVFSCLPSSQTMMQPQRGSSKCPARSSIGCGLAINHATSLLPGKRTWHRAYGLLFFSAGEGQCKAKWNKTHQGGDRVR